METKRCTHCLEDKSVNSFYVKVRKSGKLHPYAHCKRCHDTLTRAWRVANRQKALDWKRANYDPGRQAVYSARYAKRHPELLKERNRQNRLKYPEMIRQLKAAWRKANPDSNRAYCNNRRVRKLANGGRLTATQIKDLFQRQNGKCLACRKSICNGYHVDHVVPIFLGGANSIENIQLLCSVCNMKKGSKPPEIWAAEIGRLFV